MPDYDTENITQQVADEVKALGEKVNGAVDNLTGRMDRIETALARGHLPTGTEDAKDERSLKAFAEYLRRGETGISAEARNLLAAETKAMTVGSDPDGGYLVPTVLSGRILRRIYESSPLRQLATVESIGSSSLELLTDDDEAAAGWVGETESRPETSTPQVGKLDIPVHELYALPKASQKLLEDSGIDLNGWLSDKLADQFARTEATAFITGNGVKQPRGILTYANGTGRQEMEQVNSGHASTLTADGLINLVYALPEHYSAGAAFMMRRTTLNAVRLLKDGNGNYLWRPGMDAGQPSTLLGYPVYEAADMPAVAASALAVAFGNFREAYTVVDRIGISVMPDPYTSKPHILFYGRKRVGGALVDGRAIKLQVISA